MKYQIDAKFYGESNAILRFSFLKWMENFCGKNRKFKKSAFFLAKAKSRNCMHENPREMRISKIFEFMTQLVPAPSYGLFKMMTVFD